MTLGSLDIPSKYQWDMLNLLDWEGISFRNGHHGAATYLVSFFAIAAFTSYHDNRYLMKLSTVHS